VEAWLVNATCTEAFVTRFDCVTVSQLAEFCSVAVNSCGRALVT
jgi:hypothetical protein